MRGPTEALEADAAGQSKKHDREEEPGGGAGGQHQKAAAGLQQIEGVVQNLSELRRRSRKAAKEDGPASTLPAPTPAAGEKPVVHKSSESSGTKSEGALFGVCLTRDGPAQLPCTSSP